MMSTLETLDPHTFCRTESGRFLYHRGNLFFEDEFKQHTYPNRGYDEKCEVIPCWPGLVENQAFSLITKYDPRKLHPNQPFLFATDEGFRFRVVLNEYRIGIHFRYQSTDPRVGMAGEWWTANAGQLMQHLVGQMLRISYKEKPMLHLASGMEIPKQ